MEKRILFSGFGGQGVLFLAKYMAHIGLEQGLNVSWMPSYGPEMRGGSCRCGVILSDNPIGNPVVVQPDILVAMNIPSLLNFAQTVKPGGTLLYDASIITQTCEREDITIRPVNATQMAEENGLKGLANMIMAGAVLSELGDADEDTIKKAMRKTVPERKREMFEANVKAVSMGMGAV